MKNQVRDNSSMRLLNACFHQALILGLITQLGMPTIAFAQTDLRATPTPAPSTPASSPEVAQPKAPVRTDKSLVKKAQPQAAKEVAPANESVLSLGTFLDQVRAGNEAFTSSRQTSEGAGQRATEFKLLTRPTLIGSVNTGRTQAETGNPIQGDDSRQTAYSLGVQEVTNFGLTAALTYNVTDAAINSALITPNTFTTAGPVLTLTQSLWRNWFGDEIRATQQLLEAGALATKYQQSFAQIQILADAETTYWRLALAREQVLAARQILALTDQSQKWSANRQRLALGDRSDLLQANAAMLARQLDLQLAVDNERTAARYFNTIRGVDADVVSDNLVSFDPAMIERLKVPDRVKFRDDVKAAEQLQRVTAANARIAEERNTPLINITGVVGLNGRDSLTGEAINESFGTNHPNYAVGLTLNVPIDQWTGSEVRAGYRKEAVAADVLFRRRVFEQERNWHDLSILFENAVGRYRIAAEQEKAQRTKLDYERDRRSRGRTTLYQVILFEGDYAASQLARIRAQADVLNAYAQLKTFGTSTSEVSSNNETASNSPASSDPSRGVNQ